MLQDYELRFEERVSAATERLLAAVRQTGVRIGSRTFTPTPGVGGASGFSTSIALFPINASSDFNAMLYRYRNAPNASVFLGVPLRTMVSPATLAYLREVGARTWRHPEAGNYQIGLTSKSRSWRLQSHWERRNMGNAAENQDVMRLDYIAASGRTDVFDFGEISCGRPGLLPFVLLRLSVP
jgi:hypothetical protein